MEAQPTQPPPPNGQFLDPYKNWTNKGWLPPICQFCDTIHPSSKFCLFFLSETRVTWNLSYNFTMYVSLKEKASG